MRLLDTGSLTLHSFIGRRIPEYGILSHTWRDDEVTFEDINHLSSPHAAKSKAGFEKVRRTCALAARDGFKYVWIDTCCIDKSSTSELSEAINSMWKWYQRSRICYAFLDDVQTTDDLAAARWFTRGWTLQELLAPTRVIFLNKHWDVIGTRMRLAHEITKITGIDTNALESGWSLLTYIRRASIAVRMSWASSRQTTREEDLAYCLLGLFDVNMPLLYGEGIKAFERLQEEIMRHSTDQSILAWKYPGHVRSGPVSAPVLARHPRAFKDSADILPTHKDVEPFFMTNKGLRISLPIRNGCGVLACYRKGDITHAVGIPLLAVEGKGNGIFTRDSASFEMLPSDAASEPAQRIYILRTPHQQRNREFLWVRSYPTDSYRFGPCRIKYRASQGQWDVTNRTIEMDRDPESDRVYELKVECLKGPSFLVSITVKGLTLDGARWALTHIPTERHPDASIRKCRGLLQLDLGNREAFSTALHWGTVLSHKVLILDIYVGKLPREPWSFSWFSRLNLFGFIPSLKWRRHIQALSLMVIWHIGRASVAWIAAGSIEAVVQQLFPVSCSVFSICRLITRYTFAHFQLLAALFRSDKTALIHFSEWYFTTSSLCYLFLQARHTGYEWLGDRFLGSFDILITLNNLVFCGLDLEYVFLLLGMILFQPLVGASLLWTGLVSLVWAGLVRRCKGFFQRMGFSRRAGSL